MDFFCFQKSILSENKIFNRSQGRKRGFRIYRDWDIPENPQAVRTKKCQSEYFIDLTDLENLNHDKFTEPANHILIIHKKRIFLSMTGRVFLMIIL
ncbi:MepB family protein [Epilithonimonas bovis]|uniref:MepB family protein n=1 Tax=Epilithonimonas bovis TaxID=421530 RepID=UPI000977F079